MDLTVRPIPLAKSPCHPPSAGAQSSPALAELQNPITRSLTFYSPSFQLLPDPNLRIPPAPYPILILRGPSGSGKSLAARVLRSLIDPSAAPFTPLPSSAREFLTLARLNWVLAFDHVSTLTPPISDTLCRLTSGVGVACREPGHTEPLQLFLKRPVLLTVTDRWTPPPDLAARALTVTLPPLTEDTRRPDHEIAHTIQQAFPRILGALCTAVSHALACPPQGQGKMFSRQLPPLRGQPDAARSEC